MLTPRRFLPIALLTLIPAAATVAGDENGAPQFPRAITGRVTDADGEPLDGALVEWGYFTDGPENCESVETDAEGRYRLETSNVSRDFRLGVSHPGFAPFIVDAIIPGPADEPTTIDVTLVAGVSITLRVTDAAGNPLPGLAVTPQTPVNGPHLHTHSHFPTHCEWQSEPFPPLDPATPLPGRQRTVTTDENGRVTLVDLPAPSVGLRIVRNGIPDPRYWLSVVLHKDAARLHDFQITVEQAIDGDTIDVAVPHYQVPGNNERQAGMIRGSVVDRLTREPITEFIVTLAEYVTPVQPRPLPIAVAASDGEFSVGSLVPERIYYARVFAPGYAVDGASIQSNLPGAAEERTFRLRRHPSLEGRLVDAVTGAPLSHVQIVAGFAPERLHKTFHWSALDKYADGYYGLTNVLRVATDEDGRFTVPEHPTFPVSVVILTDGYERRIVPHWRRPDAGNDGVVPIALQPASSITAIALRDTQLGGEATAVALSFTSNDGFEHNYDTPSLDESGRLRFDSLAAGEYTISLNVDHQWGSYDCYTRHFTLNPGEHREIRLGGLPGSLRVHGVTDPFATVQFWPQFPSEMRNLVVYADIDGRFELQDLLPGEYKVCFHILHASSGRINCCRWQTIELTEDSELMLPNSRLGPGDR